MEHFRFIICFIYFVTFISHSTLWAHSPHIKTQSITQRSPLAWEDPFCKTRPGQEGRMKDALHNGRMTTIYLSPVLLLMEPFWKCWWHQDKKMGAIKSMGGGGGKPSWSMDTETQPLASLSHTQEVSKMLFHYYFSNDPIRHVWNSEKL